MHTWALLAKSTTDQGFHLTTTEVAFAVPVGVVIAAIISFLALRWSTNRTIENQRDTLATTLKAQREQALDALESQQAIARDDRLFAKRYEIYTEFLADVYRIVDPTKANFDNATWWANLYNDVADWFDKVLTAVVEVSIITTSETRAAMADFATSISELVDVTYEEAQVGHDNEMTAADEEVVQTHLSKIRTAETRLRTAMQDELTGEKRATTS